MLFRNHFAFFKRHNSLLNFELLYCTVRVLCTRSNFSSICCIPFGDWKCISIRSHVHVCVCVYMGEYEEHQLRVQVMKARVCVCVCVCAVCRCVQINILYHNSRRDLPAAWNIFVIVSTRTHTSRGWHVQSWALAVIFIFKKWKILFFGFYQVKLTILIGLAQR